MTKDADTQVKMIIGLGNPGPEYENTRHNVGATTVRLLASRLGAPLRKHASRTWTSEARVGTLPGGAPGPRVILAIAQTYMNVCGGPLARLAQFHKIGPENVLVIHDDLDLPAHQLRLKRGGGEGGHNGLTSLSQHLKTRDYVRLRIGIGRPPGRQSASDYVLAPIPVSLRGEWDVTFELAADAAEDAALRGLIAAQRDLHSATGLRD